MKWKILYTILIILSGIKCKTIYPVIEYGYNIPPDTKSFVVIDGGISSAPGIVIKKKRNEVVKEMKDQYLISLSSVLQKKSGITCINDTALTTDAKNMLLQKDSSAIAGLRNIYKSSIILILKDCSAGFRQGDINKTKDSNGNTSKTAEYDVFFDADWMIIADSTIHERTISASRYHSIRNVLSGLLARGPGFETNKEDILAMAQQNASSVALLFKY